MDSLFGGKDWTQLVCVHPPYRGGTGRVAAHFAELFPNMRTITPAYSDRQEPSKPAEGVPVRFAIGNAAILKNIDAVLERTNNLLLHYPFFGVIGPVIRWKMARPSRKLIVWYHQDPVSGDWRNIIFRLTQRWLFPLLIRVADTVLCNSADYAEHSDLQYTTYKNKFVPIPFSLPNSWFTDFAAAYSGREGFLFVGGLDRAHDFKGVAQLIAVWKRMQNPPKLTIAGDGPDRLRFEMEAAGLPIRFVQPHDVELLHLYDTSRFLVVNSQSAMEAFSMVALEAQARGLPVIAPNLPGVRTVADIDELRFPTKDIEALQAVVEHAARADETLWTGWSTHSLAHAQTYSDSVIARKLAAVLEGKKM